MGVGNRAVPGDGEEPVPDEEEDGKSCDGGVGGVDCDEFPEDEGAKSENGEDVSVDDQANDEGDSWEVDEDNDSDAGDGPGDKGGAAKVQDKGDSLRTENIAAAGAGVAVVALVAMVVARCMLSRRREAAVAGAAKGAAGPDGIAVTSSAGAEREARSAAGGAAKDGSCSRGGSGGSAEVLPGDAPPSEGEWSDGRERSSLSSLVSPATKEFLETSNSPSADYWVMCGRARERSLESALARGRRIWAGGAVDEV